MSKFFIGKELHRIMFPDNEWVDVKGELSQKDQDYVINSMTKAKASTKPEIEITLGKQAILEVSIVDWSFTDEGNKVPVNPENISNLRIKYRSRILTEIDKVSAESNAFLKN
jgi:hypothetical protein